MIKNCKECGEEMSRISIVGNHPLFLDNDKIMDIFVCGNRSCEQFGLLKVVSECPDHLDGHHFIECDEWSRTCSCGEIEK